MLPRVENVVVQRQLRRWEFKPSLWPTLATLVLLPILVYLGLWQYGRAQDKSAMTNEYAQAVATQSQLLSQNLAQNKTGVHFTRVQLTGHYEKHRQFLLDNRTHGGRAGYEVYTVLRSQEPSYAVLVNRGWLPVGTDRNVLPDLSLDGMYIEAEGLVAAPPRPGLLLGPSGYSGDVWPRVVQLIDLKAAEQALGYSLLPIIVLLSPDDPQGFVREWRPFIGISPQRHHGYSVQWFSLAIVLLGLYIGLNIHRRPHSQGDPDGPKRP